MIEIKELTFSRGKNLILDAYSTVIQSPGTTLLSGPNGSGKTTLLQLIGGVLKPDSGSIFINGYDLSELKTKEQAALRSIAPQRRIFEFAFTVQEIFEIIKVKNRAAHAPEVFDALEVHDLLGLKVTELSLGQQQRVSVALALIQSAGYYLLDEPFSAQDSEFAQKMLDLISSLSKKTGVLVVSHNTGQIERYFQEIIHLS